MNISNKIIRFGSFNNELTPIPYACNSEIKTSLDYEHLTHLLRRISWEHIDNNLLKSVKSSVFDCTKYIIIWNNSDCFKILKQIDKQFIEN